MIRFHWEALDESVAQNVVNALNDTLAKTNKPDFVGFVKISKLNFGSVAPLVQVLHSIERICGEFVVG